MLRKSLAFFYAYQRFIRFPAFGLTAMLPLLGASTAGVQIPGRQLWGLLGVAFAFHQFGYVLNDVVDLPVDRQQPRRAAYPLVRGDVKPGQALLFSLLQIPIAFGINAAISEATLSVFVLAIAFISGALYDIWGKRLAWPPLTDFVQGIAWVGMVLYGTAVTNSPPTQQTWLLSGFMLIYIMLVNGGHASLRDLDSDLALNMRTTAIWLGAALRADGRIQVSRRLMTYMLLLQTVLTFLLIWPLLSRNLGGDGVTWVGVLTAVSTLQIICFWLTLRTLQHQQIDAMPAPVMAYVVLSLLSLIILYLPTLNTAVRVAILLTFLLPILIQEKFYNIVKWFWQKQRHKQPVQQ